MSQPTSRGFNPQPKHVYLRSEAYRRWVSTLPCAHCGRPGPSQAAHSDAGAHGKGKGIKADDSKIFPACADEVGRSGCHSMLGATGLFRRAHQQMLANKYIEKTETLAKRLGEWPKDWK